MQPVIADTLALLFEALLAQDEDRIACIQDTLASIPLTEQDVLDVVKASAFTIYFANQIQKAWQEILSFQKENKCQRTD